MDNGSVKTSLRELVDGSRENSASTPSGTKATPSVARVIAAQEETARRIAQSLHDEASQMLAIVYLELANIARKSPEPTAERIDRVIKHLDSVCEQIRGLSHELHPMVLEQNGLLPALRQLARGVSKRSGLDVQVIGETADLDPAIGRRRKDRKMATVWASWASAKGSMRSVGKSTSSRAVEKAWN